MNIKDLIYKTPEMTEEKLLEIISKNLGIVNQYAKKRLRELHKESSLSQAFLDEYDLIQDKKSFLTKSERDQITGFVGLCMIKMTKGNE